LGNKVLLPEYGQKKVLIERSCQAWNETLSENDFIKNLGNYIHNTPIL
jgi:hypothetical protein